jgi:peroxiredoxin
MDVPAAAPDLDVAIWLNSDGVALADLRGRVVVLEAFQMLCPACVNHSLPQAARVQRVYPSEDLAVVGLHTVFEHHDVMGPDALATFVAEFRYTFPIGVDRHDDPADRIPATMRAYALQGTPSTVLIDRDGRIRSSSLGAIDDLTLGTGIGRLLAEPRCDEVVAPSTTSTDSES